MPYIPPARRPQLDPLQHIDPEQPAQGLVISPAQNTGELNYQITRLVSAFIVSKGGNYDAINAAVGVLECAKLEAYRRIAAPYECDKLSQNGDVYL